MADKAKSGEQPLLKLPAGHPQSGYVGPDLSFRDGAGTLPDEDQQAHEDALSDREDQVAQVAEAEDAAAKKEQAEKEQAEEAAQPKAEKAETAAAKK